MGSLGHQNTFCGGISKSLLQPNFGTIQIAIQKFCEKLFKYYTTLYGNLVELTGPKFTNPFLVAT